MSLGSAFDIAGSGMSAQSMRLNTIASNLANADTVAASPEEAYRARHPVFQSVPDRAKDNFDTFFNRQLQSTLMGKEPTIEGGVDVESIIQSRDEAQSRYQPSHPLADEQGYVYVSTVNIVEQMADMISASRSFEMNAQVANTSKSMLQRLVSLGR